MRCASCNCENEAGAQFCEECGTPLVRACPSCGREVRPTAKFCSKCGTSLVGPSSVQGLESRVPSPQSPDARPNEAERRQLTVMFCDVVGSIPLVEKLDPEELRQVILAYQQVCAEEIRRFDGYLARYVGDGLLVYFSYPQAHEDDAQRAVRAGLGIVAALPAMNTRLQHTGGALQEVSLQVRIGIHTGLVVVGDMGGGGYRDPLAIVGETPNIAARVQGQAEPNTVFISQAIYRLVQGFFTCEALGPQSLKNVAAPIELYRVRGKGEAHTRFEVSVQKGLTPLVGREEELSLLQRRWTQAKDGAGKAVLLSGEPGIGKSRLVQELKEHISAEGTTRIEVRCSPYHQNSALYPIIDHLQRLLQFAREDAPGVRLEKLQHTLSHYRFPQADTASLLAALLSLPHPEGSPPITVSPQKQKEKTQAALVAWLVEDAQKAAVFCVWEDMHWADPSTLEVLTLLLDQVSTTRLLALVTFRPEFVPPWGNRSHLSQLTLSRLGRTQVEAMVEQVTGSTALPPEVVQQIVSKTDGVPLFVEELTKMVVEAEADVGARRAVPLPLGIPSTLQDALMARLDRLGAAKEIAQLGATLGREFSYELLHAVSPLDEGTLQQGLRQLVEVELLYQRGLLPHPTYLFKHALIQDTAYQSLLKSKRQRYHQQIAHVLEAQFPETKETQPELVAHHYTGAGIAEQAIPYWQQAGERATQRSAHVEAIAHLSKGLELLNLLPDTPERTRQELTLQIALGAPLMATKGLGVPEVEYAYTRARELCRQVGETPQLSRVLGGLYAFYIVRAELQTTRELGEQLLRLAQSMQDPALLLRAYSALGPVLFHLGEVASAQEHLEQGIALYNPQKHRSRAFLQDPGVVCLSYAVLALWHLGYPDQALKRSHEALTLAQELSHPYSLGFALNWAATLHQLRREGQLTQERAESVIVLSTEQGFPFWLAIGTILRGWVLTEQGQVEEGITQIRQGLAARQATGTELARPAYLTLLAEACGKGGQAEEGLSVLAEALAAVDKTGERYYKAELHRLKGELTLQREARGWRLETSPPSSQASSLKPQVSPVAEQEAEGYFLKAIDIARQQQAKSWELRASTSLARLWQQQDKREDARQLLAEIYGWFTEGFETKDLQEAKALLEELA